MRKGQSAMEYLMTYGWAILIIVIIFAILFIYIKPFSIPEYCMSKDPAFSCEGLRIDSSGRLYAKITNTMYKPIKVSGIACVPTGETPAQYNQINKDISSQQNIREIWDVSSTVTCKDAKTRTPYSGTIYIQYKEADAPTTVPNKIGEISFSTTVG